MFLYQQVDEFRFKGNGKIVFIFKLPPDHHWYKSHVFKYDQTFNTKDNRLIKELK